MMSVDPGVDLWAEFDPTVCPVCGRDACEDHLPQPVERARDKVTIRPRLRIQRAIDVINAPGFVAIVEGIAYADCVTVLVSESGTGKTFALLDIASAISDGVPWHGRAVRQGSVLYLSFEGDAPGLRLRALRDVAGGRLEHLYVVHPHDPLSPRVTRDGETCGVGEIAVLDAIDWIISEQAAAGGPPVALIIIDTVRASLAGSEDNS